MKILADASLPGLSDCFPNPFELTRFHHPSDLIEKLPGQDILLCRSTLKVTAELLNHSNLRYVATASSGIDHIDEKYLKTQGIKLIDAKGSNARAVADYVLASLAYLQQNTAFRGHRAFVIGMGAVGSVVAKALSATGFEVVSYDPLKSNFQSCDFEAISACHLICVHANLHDNPPYPSRQLLNADTLALLQPNSAIINASRGDIIDEDALLKLKTPIYYGTDVFLKEPAVNDHIIDFASLCTPHIAGHSLESKVGAVIMVSQKLHQDFQLALPNYPQLSKIQAPVFSDQPSWQDYVLSLYNPIDETLALKLSGDKKQAFIELRKAHQFRHDFNCYESPWRESFSCLLDC
jgi:erythronate-4-phosphate dehydrogenase